MPEFRISGTVRQNVRMFIYFPILALFLCSPQSLAKLFNFNLNLYLTILNLAL